MSHPHSQHSRLPCRTTFSHASYIHTLSCTNLSNSPRWWCTKLHKVKDMMNGPLLRPCGLTMRFGFFWLFLFTLLVHFNPCGLRTSNLISTGRMKVFQMTLASKAPGAKIITPLKTYTLKSCNNKDMLVLRMSITLTWSSCVGSMSSTDKTLNLYKFRTHYSKKDFF